jgi:hypothetical protein
MTLTGQRSEVSGQQNKKRPARWDDLMCELLTATRLRHRAQRCHFGYVGSTAFEFGQPQVVPRVAETATLACKTQPRCG